MSYELFIAFFSASSFITFLPGPTVLLIVHYALQYGRWSGRYSIPATILGDVTALALAFAGLGTILKLFPEWFLVLKTAGGIYMIILGLIGLRSNATIAQENTADAKPPGRTVFMHVFLITAFNPKTIIFFLAFFPLFIDPTLNTTKQMLIMGTIFVALGAVGAVIYDLAAAKISIWIRRFSSSRIIHITTAIILCGLGLTTIFL